jgi:hypothetical protein
MPAMAPSASKRAASVPPGGGPSSAAPQIQAVGKYFAIPEILVRKHRQKQRWDEFIAKAWRDDGMFRRYLEAEKHTTELRIRKVGRQMDGFRQNNKSEWRLKAAVPMREFLRFQRLDKDFWSDDSNLRSLKRDNPNMAIYV